MQHAAEALIEKPELAAALDAKPAARRHGEAVTSSPLPELNCWVMSAKRPETRQRRVTTIVDEASKGRRANS
jgi:uncharacterized protein YdeI (YjbR/CyaY-like superfamily)